MVLTTKLENILASSMADDEKTKLIGKLLDENNLKILDLSECKFLFILPIIKALGNNKNISHVIWGRNVSTTQTEISAIVEILRSNNTITDIDFCESGIGSKNIQPIVEALKKSSITRIDLQENELGDLGAQSVADLLLQNNSIEFISLANNSISSKGAELIIKALEINRKVISVTFQHNDITYSAVQYISNLIRKNKSISTINLSCNYLGDKGIKSIANALKENNSITCIDLSNNRSRDADISFEGIKALADSVNTNMNLIHLGISLEEYEGAEKIDNYITEKTQRNGSNLLELIDYIKFNFDQGRQTPYVKAYERRYLKLFQLYNEENVKNRLKIMIKNDMSVIGKQLSYDIVLNKSDQPGGHSINQYIYERSEKTLNEVKDFIILNYFFLVGVCKESITNIISSFISDRSLPLFVLKDIFSHLGDNSLHLLSTDQNTTHNTNVNFELELIGQELFH